MIEVDDITKVRLAKIGANKMFGVDYDTRQTMDEPELIDLFDRVWTQGVERSVVDGEKCSAEEAARRLADKYHGFIDARQSHRSFRYRKAEFIAQLKVEDDSSTLTQLWRVSSSDTHPENPFRDFRQCRGEGCLHRYRRESRLER